MAEFADLVDRVKTLHHEAGEVLVGLSTRELEAMRSAGLEPALLSRLEPKLAAIRATAAE